jgi:hypothetical protein
VEPPFDLAKTRDFILTHGMSEEPRVYALVETVPDNVNAKSVIKKLGMRRESGPTCRVCRAHRVLPVCGGRVASG